MSADITQLLLERLEQLDAKVTLLARGQQPDWYSIEEFAAIVKRASFTVRSWARNGRIAAHKKLTGRGPHAAWSISAEELARYQRDGLLPARR
jgi:hypothetical protein